MNRTPSDGSDFSPTGLSRIRHGAFVACGFFFVGLAVLGVLLPLLPTTPFLLLASWCFMRSSPRWNAWLLRTRLFGPFLRDWQRHRAIRLSVKIVAIGVMAMAVGASALFGSLPLHLMVVLIAAATIGLVVILRIPTLRLEAEFLAGGSGQADPLATDPLQGQ